MFNGLRNYLLHLQRLFCLVHVHHMSCTYVTRSTSKNEGTSGKIVKMVNLFYKKI